MSLAELPEELIPLIFSHLDAASKISFSLSNAWINAIGEKYLNLSLEVTMKDILEAIARGNYLTLHRFFLEEVKAVAKEFKERFYFPLMTYHLLTSDTYHKAKEKEEEMEVKKKEKKLERKNRQSGIEYDLCSLDAIFFHFEYVFNRYAYGMFGDLITSQCEKKTLSSGSETAQMKKRRAISLIRLLASVPNRRFLHFLTQCLTFNENYVNISKSKGKQILQCFIHLNNEVMAGALDGGHYDHFKRVEERFPVDPTRSPFTYRMFLEAVCFSGNSDFFLRVLKEIPSLADEGNRHFPTEALVRSFRGSEVRRLLSSLRIDPYISRIYSQEHLILAIERGDWELVKWFQEEGVLINAYTLSKAALPPSSVRFLLETVGIPKESSEKVLLKSLNLWDFGFFKMYIEKFQLVPMDSWLYSALETTDLSVIDFLLTNVTYSEHESIEVLKKCMNSNRVPEKTVIRLIERFYMEGTFFPVTLFIAIDRGCSFAFLKYLRKKGIQWQEPDIPTIIYNSNFRALRLAYEEMGDGFFIRDDGLVSTAICKHDFAMAEFLLDKGYKFGRYFEQLVQHSDMRVLKWVHKHGGRFSRRALNYADMYRSSDEVVSFLYDIGANNIDPIDDDDTVIS